MTALPQEERYTYADYLNWPTGDRVKVAVLEDCYVDLGPVFLD